MTEKFAHRPDSSCHRSALIAPPIWLFAAGVLGLTHMAGAQEANLADFFGFDPMEIIVVDDGFGPVEVGDLNGDGLNDLVVVNNTKSRLELYYQRREPIEESALADLNVNEFEPLWRFEHEHRPVSHRVGAVVIHDFSGDGSPDIIYAGAPDEIVMLEQTDGGAFDIVARRRATGLSAGREGMAIANLIGDSGPELVVVMGEEIHLFPITPSGLDQPGIISTGARIGSIRLADFTGDGRIDLMAVSAEDATPIRLWAQDEHGGRSTLTSHYRFETPPLRELEILRLPRRDAASIAVIERVSSRWALYDIAIEDAAGASRMRAPLTVYSLPNASGRDVEVADVNSDGLLDLIATDPESNSILLYQQERGRGPVEPGRFATLAEPKAIAIGNVDSDPAAELFVLSEAESIVGRSEFDGQSFTFPTPLPTQDELVTLDLIMAGEPMLAVVTKSRRDYNLLLVRMDGESTALALNDLSKAPSAIIGWDADQDNDVDMLVFTPGDPTLMLRRNAAGEFEVLTQETMGQYGLIETATRANTAFFDVDGDNVSELLVADRNFVRAARYETDPGEGVSPGWQVVEQYNLANPRSKLNAIAVAGDHVFVFDEMNRRLLPLVREGETWREGESLAVEGFDVRQIYAGAFTGGRSENVLAVGEDGFAIIRVQGGGAVTLQEFASYRNDDEDRFEHELTAGDVNGDGFLDVIALDSREQMLGIYTISEARRLLRATEFEVFQSQQFQGGASSEYEPRNTIIADVTGDGADDLLLIIHDRILIYPQATEPTQ